ncbi:hypothetical protein [Streptomyces sp. CB03238]|uniref:hypothetical protein n=1 Tax=Streptomyces sp. CB03238 TaxID=1907777 RepID=UPI000A122A71|nr:hypothetical protein [Streptomyces sp. CB03238]ORT54194.1 hypothetical protein BKD26_35980 [Streptomyces sp. CB03238]
MPSTNPSKSSRRARLTRLGRLAVPAALTVAALAIGPQAGMAYAATAAELAAPAPVTPSSAGLSDWIENNLLNIAFLVVGLVVIFRAKGKDWNGALVTGGIAIFGIAIAAIGTGNTALGLGQWLVGLVTAGNAGGA